MKKMITLLVFCVLTTGCFSSTDKVKEESDDTTNINNSDEIIKIMEPVYLDYVQEIYLDTDEYIGKTIEIEGIFTTKYDEMSNKNSYYIYRLSDSISSHDGDSSGHSHDHEEAEEVMSGFEFTYNGEIPQDNDWIKLTGVIEQENDNLIIRAKSVNIMSERGLEKVKLFY